MNKNFFMLDNNIFNFKLDAYEFQIYAYLVSCAGRLGECWPRINTMARLLNISTNTVIKKIDSLISKKLIQKINTISRNRNGKFRTSNNHYVILPFDDAWNEHFRFSPTA